MRTVSTALAALLSIAAALHSAHAEAADDIAEEAIETYFDLELKGAAAVGGVGVGSAYIAGSLFANGSDLARGAAIPIVAVGALQVAVSSVILIRTRSQVAALKKQHREDPAGFATDELARMQGINFWFDVYKAVEIGLLGVGVAGIVAGALDDRDMLLGAGIGLSTQSVIMLAVDLIAEASADGYTEKLRALSYLPSLRPTPHGMFVSLDTTF